MRRKTLLYFGLLGSALSLFALAAWLTVQLDGDLAELGLIRFVVLCLAVGCSIGTWATAVTIASVHRRTWALYVTLAIVILACLTFASICYHAPPARL